MKKSALIAMASVLSFSLSACGGVKEWKNNLNDYVYTMNFHENFNVLQLTDIHWSNNSSTTDSKQYLEKLFNEVEKHIKAAQGNNAKIDLVELTGDQFMLSNSYHVKTFLQFFEEQAVKRGFMYTAIWGNHDRHGLYNPNWLSDQHKKAEHCIYIEDDDNLYGRSNFVINLNQGANTKWQLFNLDSGASFSETAISPFRDYDYIRQDQVDWYVAENQLAGNAPAIAYYHIPQQDNLEAWNKIHKDGANLKHKFFKLEGFADNGNEEYASNFISTAGAHNLKAAFQGHAHNVDWTVLLDNGVVLGLGVKTGVELYYAHIDPADNDPALQEGLESVGINEKFDLIGASLVTIKDETNFDLEHLYYNERTSGDFVKWVKW